MTPTRRRFLTGAGALLMAPAIVRASSLEYVPRTVPGVVIMPPHEPGDVLIIGWDVTNIGNLRSTLLYQDQHLVIADQGA